MRASLRTRTESRKPWTLVENFHIELKLTKKKLQLKLLKLESNLEYHLFLFLLKFTFDQIFMIELTFF